MFPDLVVKNGPFSGMKYPKLESAGSAFLPKLLGSYEKELEPIFNKIIQDDFTDIIDTGCAEGYYAVGLAMKKPSVKVKAFDTDPKAQELCKEMAQLNGVADRVYVNGTLTPESLMNMEFKGKALVISDCEGYEKNLFTKEVAQKLKNHHLLIEVHDIIDLEISETLRKNFAETHNIEVITSTDDLEKMRSYNFKELSKYSKSEKLFILQEARGHIMEWFYATPK